MNAIGAVISERRHAEGVTQEALAAHLGVTKAAVSKWELGQSCPDVCLLPKYPLPNAFRLAGTVEGQL